MVRDASLRWPRPQLFRDVVLHSECFTRLSFPSFSRSQKVLQLFFQRAHSDSPHVQKFHASKTRSHKHGVHGTYAHRTVLGASKKHQEPSRLPHQNATLQQYHLTFSSVAARHQYLGRIIYKCLQLHVARTKSYGHSRLSFILADTIVTAFYNYNNTIKQEYFSTGIIIFPNEHAMSQQKQNE